MKKSNNITKNKVLSVFQIVTYNIAIMYGKYPIWGNEKKLRETFIMSVF